MGPYPLSLGPPDFVQTRNPGGAGARLTGTSKEQHVDLFQKVRTEGVDLWEEPKEGDGREATQKYWK